tara:strand:+ start:1011 stop:1904 length:894 start_codon:yes stop_codon:yes gene_type:complete
MKKIVLIQSHCNTKEKLDFLKSNLIKLKALGLDILLFSHITLPEEIVNLTDYFIYDKSNPIMWDERRHVYWKTLGNIKLTSTNPEYGWTVFNQVIKSSHLTLHQDYDYFYLMCYDTVIEDTVTNTIKNPKPCITFRHYKHEDFISNSTLIFSCFDKLNLSNLLNLLNRTEYSQSPNLVAEQFLEEKLKLLGTCVFSESQVTDQFHESTDIFNQNTHNNKFKIFLSNEGEFRCLVHDVKCELVLIVNTQAYTINEHKLLDLSDHTIINNLGYLLDGEYYNLLSSYNKLSLRKIESLNV